MAWKIVSSSIPTEAPSEESLLGKGLRHGVRSLARASEAAVGLPGDLFQTGINALDWGNQAIENYKKPGSAKPWNLKSPLPTSEQVKEFNENTIGQLLPENTLKSQNENEERADTFVGDLASLLVPIGGAVKPVKAAAMAGLGNLASWGAEELGVGEGGQQAAKVGSMLLTSLVGTPSAQKYATGLYDKIEKILPEEVTISADKLGKDLASFKKAVNVGDSPAKEFITKRINAVEKAIDPITNRVPGRTVLELKRNANEWLREPTIPKAARKKLGDLSYLLTDNLKKEAKSAFYKTNPASGVRLQGPYKEAYSQFSNLLTEADDIWKGIKNKGTVEKFFDKWVNKKLLRSPFTAFAFGHNPVGAASAIGVGLGAKNISEIIGGFNRSPAIRKYYNKALTAALSDNKTAFARYIKSIDDEFAKNNPEVQKGWKIVSTTNATPSQKYK